MSNIVAELRDRLNDEFVNRAEEIDVITLALASKSHVVALGPPGTGKTALMDRLCAHLGDVKFFSTLIMRDSDTSALFGPYSLAGLKEDRRVRAEGNWLQYADLGFVDECFKGNATVLNGLLKIMNERQFESDGNLVDAPLSTLMGASNEMPDLGDGLAALWDRWHFRLYVDSLTDPTDLLRLANINWDASPEPVGTWDDMRALQDAARQIHIVNDAVEALTSIIVDLKRNHDIDVSNRKLREALKILPVAAFLDGDEEATVRNLEFVRHMFWDNPDQRGTVNTVVLETADPTVADALDLRDQIAGVLEKLAEVDTLDDEDTAKSTAYTEVMTKVKRAAVKFVELEAKAGVRSKRIMGDVEKRIVAAHNSIMEWHDVPVAPVTVVDEARNGTLKMRGKKIA